MAQQLIEGLYVIRSYGDGGLFLGGVLPKTHGKVGVPLRIEALPEGVAAPRWHIYKLEDGGWGLSVRGAVTFPMDEKVYGLPMPFDHGYAWRIEPAVFYGPGVYTISSFTEPKVNGWVLPSKEPGAQVEFKPLKATRSEPPQYPESELFTILLVPRGEA